MILEQPHKQKIQRVIGQQEFLLVIGNTPNICE